MSKSKGKGQSPSFSANFGFLVKCLYQIIQCLHHGAISQDQSRGNFTKAFRTKLRDLDYFIRPAQPNSKLTQQIRQANRNWALSISNNLGNHYEDRLSKLRTEIQTLDISANVLEQAKTVALKWARQNFRSKLQTSTILAFESELFSISEPNSATSSNSSSILSTTMPIVATSTSTPKPSSSTPKPSTSTPKSSTTGPSSSTPKTSSSTARPSSTPKPSSPRTSTPKPTVSYADAVRAAGSSNSDQQNSGKIRISGGRNPLSNLFPCKLNHNGAVWPSLEHLYQYQKAIFMDQGELSDQIFSATDAHQATKIANKIPSSPLWDKHKSSFMETLLDLKYEQCEEFRVQLHQSGSAKLELRVPDMFWGTGNCGNGENRFGKLLQNLRSKVTATFLPPKTPARKHTISSVFSPDTPVTFKIIPNRHQNTIRKNQEWCFPEIREKILIMGTSNLASITESPLPNVQIESYPGAKIIHLLAILDKADKKRKLEPEHVILSVGMNDRSNSPHATTIPNFNKLLAKAKLVFPNSKIHVPQITFSDQLHQYECSHLHEVNKFIAKISAPVTALPKLPGMVGLRTPKDPVHYNKTTANKILRHWLLHLN